MNIKGIPVLESQWRNLSKSELREAVFQHLRKMKNSIIVNKDTMIPIKITVSSAKKTAFGEAMYPKKAEVIRILPALIETAKYNNFGKRKPNDSPEILGYLNFKNKCLLDGKVEHVRIAVRFQKGGKFYYNIEVNKIK